MVHAANLVSPERPDQGVLLVGPRRSGKSTLTAYAVEQGMHTNGDDYVLVDLRDDTPQCWSIYRTIKLHPSSPVLRGKNCWHTWRYIQLTLHSCMSTIQQIPYRIYVTLALAKQLHQSIPYEAHTIEPGIEGLQHALVALKGRRT